MSKLPVNVLVAACFLLAHVSAHGSVSFPPPRQGIDGSVAPWNSTVPEAIPFMFWCAIPDKKSTDARNVSGANGQACFWFNNGCDISCDECDGRTGQVVHPKFIWTGAGLPPDWADPTRQLVPNPKMKSAVAPGARPDDPKSTRLSICKQPKRNATICAPELRTININAECHSDEDYFQFAPWRAPGSAPVHDSCGVAGGVLPGQGPAAAGGDYQSTVHAKRGDIGSTLPARPTGTEWHAGEEVDVAWVQKAWHGGGYQYRLCPAESPLTEKCFQSHPVPFANGNSMLRWANGEELVFNATDVSVGTLPEGSTWRRGPFPRGPWEWYNWAASPEPVCEETLECRNAHTRPKTPPGHDPSEGTAPCKCSGSGDGDLYKVEIVDKLRLPTDLPAGDWVLGWRWDCEESTQVWNSCSDVTIKSN